MSNNTQNTEIQSLAKSLNAFANESLASDVYKKGHCVEVACALFGVLHPQVRDMKITMLICQLVHEPSNETQAKSIAHAYVEAEGETLDMHGLNAVERFDRAYPQAGPDKNGIVEKNYRIEMDMSTEERRMAALRVMSQTCDELGCSLDGEMVNLLQEALINCKPADASSEIH